MRKDKSSAVTLRKTGKSYAEIRSLLGVPKATLSDWFRNERWSKNIKSSLNRKNLEQSRVRIVALGKIRGANLARLYAEAREEAVGEFHLLKHRPLFVAGVAIYWGEGDKATSCGFRISNVDPLMIKTFRRFLLDVCRVEEKRIRTGLLLYPDLNEAKCKQFWIEEAGLSPDSFTKSVVIKGRTKNRKLLYGVCGLIYSSRFLKEKMLVWIGLLGKELSLAHNAAMV